METLQYYVVVGFFFTLLGTLLVVCQDLFTSEISNFQIYTFVLMLNFFSIFNKFPTNLANMHHACHSYQIKTTN